MLAKRDQWLRHVAGALSGDQLRRALEGAWQRLICDALAQVQNSLPTSHVDELVCLAQFAGKNLGQENPESPICACEELAGLPDASLEDLPKWQGLREMLMTQKGEWRKTATITNGFPPPSSAKKDSGLKAVYTEKKQAFQSCVAALSEQKHLGSALDGVRYLPNPDYTDAQWDIIGALFEILPVAVGYLHLAFQESGKVDFAEVALRAGIALGDADHPTDLALSMDYGIQHILMDEFQDTSFTQFELLEKLTAGWEPEDGRTLFLVGDPMQSIYGFREAEVGLFLKAWQQGIGMIALKPIQLSVNFRSQKGIIDWVNDAFPEVMPDTPNETTGAVPYAPAVAFHPQTPGQAVKIHAFIPDDREAEAAAVVACVEEAKQTDPAGSIAILVRSRSHLEAIVPELRAAGLSFRAVDIESLKNRTVISDILSLARALSHSADRVAWLSVLRGPWCGLTLNDLHALAGDDDPDSSSDAKDRTIPELMTDATRISRLSADGQRRLAAIKKILLEAIAQRHRRPFARQVEGVWTALGGPACVLSESDLEDAGVFLDLLDQQTANGALTDIEAIEEAASSLFARPDTRADESLQIMTIHKAKGLEFDTVILPGLGRKPPSPEPQLLLWRERYAGTRNDLLLAPISETGSDGDKSYEYLKRVHEQKRLFEEARLLYVACTRARKRLHLLGGTGVSNDAEKPIPPAKTSLLACLWPVVVEAFHRSFERNRSPGQEFKPAENQPVVLPYIRRVKDQWRIPDPPAEVALKTRKQAALDIRTAARVPRFDWAGETVRHVGIVVHRWLRVICEEGIENWPAERIGRQASLFETALARFRVSSESLNQAVGQVTSALENAVTDERGRWILSGHDGGACEYALTGKIDSEIITAVMDRTFVDEHGDRWIIDYKTGGHEGGALDEFLDREILRYRDQMETYADLMAAAEDRPIRLGLYFPLVKGWREI